MKRIFLVVGLFTAVMLGGVAIIPAPSRPPATPGAPDPSSAPPPVAAAPAPAGLPVEGRFKGGKLHPSAADPGRRHGERRGETSTPMADRVTQKTVRRALHAASVQSRLARCTKVEGFGGTSTSGAVPRAAPASLLLELEGSGGELRVVDAKVREWGGASEATVSCARTVLRAQVIHAPKSRLSAGERMQMHFLLNSRGDAVASR